MAGLTRNKKIVGRPYVVTAHLATPLANDPPQLDGLLVYAQSRNHDCDRSRPAPPQEKGRIPLAREWIGEWLIYHASSPIVGYANESTDYYHRQFPVNKSDLLRPDRQLVIATGNSWTKSYRLPLRARSVDRVRWFVLGVGSPLRRVLKTIRAIGKKTSIGYGRVREWTVEPVDHDYSWFVPLSGGQRVLMRPLPLSLMAEDVIGARRDFGACVPPYWHPERYGDIVVPC